MVKITVSCSLTDDEMIRQRHFTRVFLIIHFDVKEMAATLNISRRLT